MEYYHIGICILKLKKNVFTQSLLSVLFRLVLYLRLFPQLNLNVTPVEKMNDH